MSQWNQQYGESGYAASEWEVVSQAPVQERASFITRTYVHLLGAVLAFIALEFLIFQIVDVEAMFGAMVGSGGYSWLIVLGVFFVVSLVANRWAQSATSLPIQYAGLALYVVAEAIIFVPLLYVATKYGGANVIPTAAVTTLALFGALTAVVFLTRKDFSFLRSLLYFGAIAAFGFIICAIVFGFELGPIFSYAMIALMCGFILYETSNVLHHYNTNQHVAASLALFASLATLFWYVLRLYLASEE